MMKRIYYIGNFFIHCYKSPDGMWGIEGIPLPYFWMMKLHTEGVQMRLFKIGSYMFSISHVSQELINIARSIDILLELAKQLAKEEPGTGG